MARKKGINNKNRKLKKKYIYFFMEGSKNCSEDKYIRNINDENIEIWCVLDKDKNDLDQINKECIKNNYKLVFSNCSFEVWLLYHYEDIKIGKCSQKNYENILTKKLNRKYKKNEGIKFSCEDKERAIKQSKKIHEKYRILGEKINNSFNCTNFYVILEKFNEVFNKFELE